MKPQAQILIHRDSKAWGLQVWVSFMIAVFLCGVGLAYLPGKDLDRAFMVMGYFFCLSTAFVLAKFVRDNEKASAENRVADTPLFKFVVWGGFFLAKTLRDKHEADLSQARLQARLVRGDAAVEIE